MSKQNFSGKKRNKEEDFDDLSDEENIKENEKLSKNPNYMKMPFKSNFRMRAHCNPLSEVLMN
jgi:hypothetical protein